MAGGDVAGPLLLEARRKLPTEIGGQRTAAGKDAAIEPLLQARHLPWNLGEASRRSGQERAEPGNRAKQTLGIGMKRRLEKMLHRRLLRDFSGVHDDNALRDLGQGFRQFGADLGDWWRTTRKDLREAWKDAN